MPFRIGWLWKMEKPTIRIEGVVYEWVGSRPAPERGSFTGPEYYIEDGPRVLLDQPRGDWIDVWRLRS